MRTVGKEEERLILFLKFFKGGKTWQRQRPEIWPCVVVGGGGEGAWGSGG